MRWGTHEGREREAIGLDIRSGFFRTGPLLPAQADWTHAAEFLSLNVVIVLIGRSVACVDYWLAEKLPSLRGHTPTRHGQVTRRAFSKLVRIQLPTSSDSRAANGRKLLAVVLRASGAVACTRCPLRSVSPAKYIMLSVRAKPPKAARFQTQQHNSEPIKLPTTDRKDKRERSQNGGERKKTVHEKQQGLEMRMSGCLWVLCVFGLSSFNRSTNF